MDLVSQFRGVSIKASYYYLVMAIFCITIVFAQLFPFLNDMKYAVCGLFLIYPIAKAHKIQIGRFERELLKLVILWSCFFALHLAFSPSFYFVNRSIKEYIFITLPIFSILFSSNYLTKRSIESVVNFFLFSLVILEFIRNGVDFGILIDPLGFVINSETETESTYAMLYGLLLIHYISEKKWIKILLSLYLVLTGGKRIVIFSLLILGLIYYPLKWIFKKKLILPFLVSISALVIVFLIGISSNELVQDLVKEYTGVSINFLTKGRTITYSIVLSGIQVFQLIGEGLGYANYFLVKSNSQLVLMHSDLLKLYIELGTIGTLIYMVISSKIASLNMVTFSIIFYYIFLMITENSIIYIQVSLILYLLLLYQYKKQISQKESHRDII